MSRLLPLPLGLLALAIAWLGPLPAMAGHSFAAHMGMHVLVVAIAAPWLAIGIAGTRFDPARVLPRLFGPALASLVEMVVIWGWHAPALHHAARESQALLLLEQGSFLAVGLLLWLSAFGGERHSTSNRAAAGIAGLLLTSMHMTLLGVLLATASRVLYAHAGDPGLAALEDQQWGGVIMLTVGGSAYLIGGLYLLAGLLRKERNLA